MLWLSSHFTNVLYYVQLERRRGSDGSGSFITSLENLDEVAKKRERSFEVMHLCILLTQFI